MLPLYLEYVEVEDKESDELYKLKYQPIEEVFSTIDNTDCESWKEYVLNLFTKVDKLSCGKAKEFVKLTDYYILDEWYKILY